MAPASPPDSTSTKGTNVSGQKKNPPSLSKPQSTVTVIVGPHEASQRFIIHKDFICHHSQFFDKAFHSKLIEGETRVMYLDEVEVQVFGLLVSWLYTQTLPEEFDYSSLLELWLLADHFLMPSLQNQVIDVLRNEVRYGNLEFSRQHLDLIYRASEVRDTPLKRLAMDFISIRGLNYSDQDFQGWFKTLSSEAKEDIARALQARCQNSCPRYFYHELLKSEKEYHVNE